MRVEGWDIPTTPNRQYADEWKGWGDLLGTNKPRTFLVRRSLPQWREYALELASRNNGKLPSSYQLYQDHPGLHKVSRLHPDIFRDIPTERLQQRLSDHVKAANDLANRNNGLLPSPGVLFHNHNRLHHAIVRHPEAFKHLKQERRNTRGKLIGICVAGEKTLIKETK